MNEDQEIKIGLTCSDDLNDSEIPNGSEWNGEGLPPVGVECEVYGALGEYNAWNKCNVFAIELGVVFISNGRSWASRPATEFKFRKPETPEQKAERERLEEIDEMCVICSGYTGKSGATPRDSDVWRDCEKLHNSGYRLTK